MYVLIGILCDLDLYIKIRAMIGKILQYRDDWIIAGLSDK